MQFADEAAALQGIAAGADGDVDAGMAGGFEGFEVAVVDFAVPTDDGAVEIAGENLPVGVHRWSVSDFAVIRVRSQVARECPAERRPDDRLRRHDRQVCGILPRDANTRRRHHCR